MLNKKVQKIYNITKKIEYGTNFTSKKKDDNYFISIDTGKKENLNLFVRIEQELLKKFGSELDTVVMKNGLMIKVKG